MKLGDIYLFKKKQRKNWVISKEDIKNSYNKDWVVTKLDFVDDKGNSIILSCETIMPKCDWYMTPEFLEENFELKYSDWKKRLK